MNCLRISWIATLVILAATALAQAPPVITPDTLWSGGNGNFESAPDTALVQFAISAQQAESKAAYAQAQESAQKIRQTLRTNAIDPKDAEIGSFSITPVYKWKPNENFSVSRSTARSLSKFTISVGLRPLLTASRRRIQPTA